MAWGVRWYLVCSIGLGVLGVLAGCSGGNLFAEREPWRREAEVQCLNAGTVREGPGIVRIRSIQGPGVCGADFPFKVSMLGESSPLGYSDDPRPPGDIPSRTGAAPARWPVRPADAPAVQQQPPYQSRVLPEYQSRPAQPTPRGTRARSAGVARAAERDRADERAGHVRLSATLRDGAGAKIPAPA